MMPVPSAGVKPLIGNMKPVTLVSTVNSKQMAVQPGNRLDASIPNITIKLVTIAINVMMTWTVVNVSIDIPSIMACLPRNL